MILLRCPKFLRCLTADAGNFDRGHSLTSLHLPLAALSSLPTSARRTALLVTLRRGDPRGRPPAMYHTPWKPCHCEVSAHTGRGNPHLPSPNPPLPKERGILAGYGVLVCRKLVRGFPQKETAFSGGLRLSKNPSGFSDKRLAVCCAHNLSVCDGQIPHWQPELYFLSRTCRERK